MFNCHVNVALASVGGGLVFECVCVKPRIYRLDQESRGCEIIDASNRGV